MRGNSTEDSVETVRNSLVGTLEEMPVAIHSGRNGRVAEAGLYRLRVFSLVDEESDVGVA